MKAAAETVQADLLADTALQAVISGAHYWELAPKEATLPLITFKLRENKRPAKDLGGNYDLQVFCFEKTLTAAAELSELVKTALINANHRYQGGESGYTDGEAQEGYIQLNFNFNL